ncbi:MAG TPA: hypothetical protein VGR78_01575 [Verrucomicrobiae bacterium]|jgi:hypothetical protein|nr:hypothetical protein [Verrucomicrobiae bacterium]
MKDNIFNRTFLAAGKTDANRSGVLQLCTRSTRLTAMLWTIALFATIARLNTAQAALLYLPNSSFESQPTDFVDPRIDAWQKPPQPPGYDTNVFHAWDNLSGVFINPPSTNGDYIDNAEGNQLVYLFAYPQAGLFQDNNSTDWSGTASHAFDARFEPGKSYRLTAAVTSSKEAPLSAGSTLELSLYYRDDTNKMVTLATTKIVFDPTVFTNITHLIDFSVSLPAVKTNDPWAGKNIGVQIQSTVAPNLIGGVWDIDNVRLSETIAVPNFSFESQPTQFVDPRIDAWQKPPQPPGYDTNIFHAWDNLSGVFINPPSTNADYIDNAEGNQLVYLFAYPQAGLFQDNNSTDWSGTAFHAFNATFEAGKAYRLTAAVTSSREAPLMPGSTLEISLYYRDSASSMVVIAATNITYATDVFTNITHLLDFQVSTPVVRASDAWAGKNIGIQIRSTVSPNLIGGVWDIDNIRLDEIVGPILVSPARTAGQFTFTLLSEPGLRFEISANRNLVDSTGWTALATITNTTGSFPFSDSSSALPARFYRARQLP